MIIEAYPPLKDNWSELLTLSPMTSLIKYTAKNLLSWRDKSPENISWYLSASQPGRLKASILSMKLVHVFGSCWTASAACAVDTRISGMLTGMRPLAVYEGTLVQFLCAWFPEGDRR